jgi:hypothetical protein
VLPRLPALSAPIPHTLPHTLATQYLDAGVRFGTVLQRTGLSILVHPGAPPLLGAWAPFSTISWAVWLLIFFSAVVVGAVLVCIDLLAALLRALRRELQREEAADAAEAAAAAAAARRFGGGTGAGGGADAPGRRGAADAGGGWGVGLGTGLAPSGGSRVALLAAGGAHGRDAAGAQDQDGSSCEGGSCAVDAEVEVVTAAAVAAAEAGHLKGGAGGGVGTAADGGVRQRRRALASPGPGRELSWPQIKADLSGWFFRRVGGWVCSVSSVHSGKSRPWAFLPLPPTLSPCSAPPPPALSVWRSLLKLVRVSDPPRTRSWSARLVLWVWGLLLMIVVAMYVSATTAQLASASIRAQITGLDSLQGKAVATWGDYVDELLDAGVPANGRNWWGGQEWEMGGLLRCVYSRLTTCAQRLGAPRRQAASQLKAPLRAPSCPPPPPARTGPADEAAMLALLLERRVEALVLDTPFVEFVASTRCDTFAVVRLPRRAKRAQPHPPQWPLLACLPAPAAAATPPL